MIYNGFFDRLRMTDFEVLSSGVEKFKLERREGRPLPYR